MKKQHFILATMAWMLPLAALAQPSKVTSGVLYYNERDYAGAIKALTEAVQNLSALNEQNQVKAFSYLGRSFATAYALSNAADPAQAQKHKAILAQYPNFVVDGLKAFSEAARLDARGTVTAQDKAMYPQLLEAATLRAFELFNANKNAEALEVVNAATPTIDKHNMNINYSAYLIKGFILRKLERPAEAIQAFERAITLYKAYEPQGREIAQRNNRSFEPDKNMASAYENLIYLYANHLRDIDKTLKIAEQGKAAFPGNQGIINGELQVFADNPQLLDQGLATFRTALESRPNDVVVMLGYANLLERRDTTQAMAMYKRAVSADPDNFLANFNLGALHNNIAASYYKMANESTNATQVQAYQENQQQNLREALKFMTKAYGSQPRNRAVLAALKNISANLNEMDLYNKYNAELQALGN